MAVDDRWETSKRSASVAGAVPPTHLKLIPLVQAVGEEVEVPAEDCKRVSQPVLESEGRQVHTPAVRLWVFRRRIAVGKVDNETVKKRRKRLEARSLEVPMKTLVSLVRKDLRLCQLRLSSTEKKRTGRTSEPQATKYSSSLLRNAESC